MAIAGQAPGRALRRSRRVPRVRDRLGRRPDGGRLGRGVVARGPPGPRQSRVPLRRQPRLDRRRHRDRVHRGPGQALRRLRLGHLDRLRRQRPRRARRGDLRRDRGRRASRRSSRSRPSSATARATRAPTGPTPTPAAPSSRPRPSARWDSTPTSSSSCPTRPSERYREIGGRGRRAPGRVGARRSTGSPTRRSCAASTPTRCRRSSWRDFLPDDGPIATRAASGKVLAAARRAGAAADGRIRRPHAVEQHPAAGLERTSSPPPPRAATCASACASTA